MFSNGFFVFHLGIEAQIWRNAVWNGAYFGIINQVKDMMPVDANEPNKVLFRNFCAGFIGGTFFYLLFYGAQFSSK